MTTQHSTETLYRRVITKDRIYYEEVSAPAQSQQQPRWRHLKRGTEYTEIGRGFAQCAWAPIEEMTAVVIYRGHDGCLWVRNAVEFDDGRFQPIETTTVTSTERGLCDCGLPLKSCAECRQAFTRPERSPQATETGTNGEPS